MRRKNRQGRWRTLAWLYFFAALSVPRTLPAEETYRIEVAGALAEARAACKPLLLLIVDDNKASTDLLEQRRQLADTFVVKPIVFDGDLRNGAPSPRYIIENKTVEIPIFPTSLLLDPAGNIYYVLSGYPEHYLQTINRARILREKNLEALELIARADKKRMKQKKFDLLNKAYALLPASRQYESIFLPTLKSLYSADPNDELGFGYRCKLRAEIIELTGLVPEKEAERCRRLANSILKTAQSLRLEFKDEFSERDKANVLLWKFRAEKYRGYYQDAIKTLTQLLETVQDPDEKAKVRTYIDEIHRLRIRRLNSNETL